MLDATTALFSFPFLISQRLSSERMVLTKNILSSCSGIAPLMDPIAQDKEFMFSKLHSDPSTYFCSLNYSIFFIFSQLSLDKLINKSFNNLYEAIFSVSTWSYLIGCPFSSSTIRTSSGFAILSIIIFLTFSRVEGYTEFWRVGNYRN